MEQGLASVETGLAGVQEDNAIPKGRAYSFEGSNLKVNGSGYIIGIGFSDPLSGDVLTIDDKTYTLNQNRYRRWLWKGASYCGSNGFYIRYNNDDTLKPPIPYYLSFVSDVFSSWEDFIYKKINSTQVGAPIDCYGLTPVRFNTGISISFYGSVLYTLDPT